MEREEAQEAFCRAAHPGLVRAFDLFCGDRHMAEELAQEALLRACRRWRHVSGLQSPEGWCYRVGINLATSRFRRGQVARRARAHVDGALPPHVDSCETSVDRALEVRAALTALTDRQRAVVVMRYFLDLDVRTAAETLGMSPGAVRAATHRALATLRQHLDVPRPDRTEASDVR